MEERVKEVQKNLIFQKTGNLSEFSESEVFHSSPLGFYPESHDG